MAIFSVGRQAGITLRACRQRVQARELLRQVKRWILRPRQQQGGLVQTDLLPGTRHVSDEFANSARIIHKNSDN